MQVKVDAVQMEETLRRTEEGSNWEWGLFWERCGYWQTTSAKHWAAGGLERWEEKRRYRVPTGNGKENNSGGTLCKSVLPEQLGSWPKNVTKQLCSHWHFCRNNTFTSFTPFVKRIKCCQYVWKPFGSRKKTVSKSLCITETALMLKKLGFSHCQIIL